jgi:hypothetical protein
VLQIISGKFYKSDDRYIHDGKGILYSNYSWIQPIETSVATLEPVDTFASVSSYVVCYKNQLEKEAPPAKNILVRTGDSEIVEQFMTICSFHLGAFFHQDRNVVAVACRDERFNSSDYCVPSQFVPRIFSRQIRGSVDETAALSEFVNNVIGLSRERYIHVMTSMRSFMDAMQVVGSNIDIAYSLLIFSLEALAQKSDSYQPIWDDYPLETKDDLDSIFKGLDEGVVVDIKNTLLRNSNLKASKRFLEFVKRHVDNEFFISESPSGYFALRKSELDNALKNAYSTRSKFAHLLQPIQELLRHPKISDGDVIRFKDDPYFSISGLVRLVQHVIKNYVKRSEKVEKEEYNWRKEFTGIITMEMAPQYWIWKHEGLLAKHATNKLSGFLSQLQSVITGSDPITDIRDVLSKYESLINGAKKPFKIQMLSMYVIYNGFVSDQYKCKNYLTTFEKYKSEFDECSIETMVSLLLMGQLGPWKVEECDECWGEHQDIRHRKSVVKLPPLLSLSILSEIAALYKEADNDEKYHTFMDATILEAAGQKHLQNFLMNAKNEGIKVRGMEVFDNLCEKKA